ncbi:zinc-dependent alcohol dehydrogenase family protein [Streptosporangium subroseum]|uniref:zinc-dependent alcohol dehydrogenase family protein n=1 Tax=Streptosporangium subroseum TaxID=106412 RepID=UPI0030935CD1|nr:zinc-dependent alcohol dehydrogenase family protein [Streptosporangium subroseum]
MAVHVRFDTLGGPEVLTLREMEVGEPGVGELRIRVEAIGLNRAEVMFRRGHYLYQPNLPSGLGYEAAGVVEAVGADAGDFAVGDTVSVVPAFDLNDYGTYGDHVLVPAAATVHRPAEIDPVTSSAVWMAYVTSYGAFAADGGVRPGDAVLITAATGGVGLAAIQVANRIGAVSIATTRSRDKKQRLLDAGAAHVIVTDEEDLAERVKEITGGRGVRTAFDPIGGPGAATIASAVAPGGTLVIYGMLDPRPVPDLQSFPELNVGFFLITDAAKDPAWLRRAVAFVNEGLTAGAFTPVIDRTFDLTEIVEAHRYMESSAQVGKIVVTVRH